MKDCRWAVAPALVACLRDATVPTAQDILHVARKIAGDLQDQTSPDPRLSLIYARVALFGDPDTP